MDATHLFIFLLKAIHATHPSERMMSNRERRVIVVLQGREVQLETILCVSHVIACFSTFAHSSTSMRSA